MKPGRELDMEIANRIFRLEYIHPDGTLPRYSTDIEAAWQVFEKLGPAWQISQSDSGGYGPNERWWVWLPEEYGGDGKTFMAASAPEAICHAALNNSRGGNSP